MAKVMRLKSKGLRRVDGEWDEACTGEYSLEALGAYRDVPKPPKAVVKLAVGYGELCGMNAAGKTVAVLVDNVWETKREAVKPNKVAPANRKWQPGYYKIERVGGAAASMGPGDRDWWYCWIHDASGGWGLCNLWGHDNESRPYGYIAGPGVYDGAGEKYLDRLAGSKYFKVTLVKPGNKIARVWPASLCAPSSGKPPAKWDYGL